MLAQMHEQFRVPSFFACVFVFPENEHLDPYFSPLPRVLTYFHISRQVMSSSATDVFVFHQVLRACNFEG